MSSSAIPPEHADTLQGFSAPIAEFKVGTLARVRIFVLTSVAVIAGMGIALGCLWCLIFGDFEMRTWLVLSGAVTAVPLYFRERTRLCRGQAHLMAHLAHLFSVGPAYLYMSLTGWRRARQIRNLRVLVFPEGLVRIQANEVDVVRWEEITVVRRAVLWQEDLEAFSMVGFGSSWRWPTVGNMNSMMRSSA